MARKQVYTKDATGFGDFIYVDLLPEVKRSRRFNVNVVGALLFAIILAFFLIYRPYRDRTFEFEKIYSINNDLHHELTLTTEEFYGYEIDMNAIQFEQDIDSLELLKIDFNNLVDDVELIVDDNGGRVKSVQYNALTNTLVVRIAIISQFSYNSINNEFLNLPWVDASIYSTPSKIGDDVQYTSTFTIEVNYNVE